MLAFSALLSHSKLCRYHEKKSAVPSILISVERIGKNQMEPSEVSNGNAPVFSRCSLLRIN